MTLAILSIIFAIIILITSAQGMPDKATQCNYCHSKLSVQVDDPECEYCHEVVRNPEGHQASICKNCHNITDTSSYHIAHNLSCNTCHPTGKLPLKIYSNCLSCHTSIHNIHNDCQQCHPSTIGKDIKLYEPFSLYNIIMKALKELLWIK